MSDILARAERAVLLARALPAGPSAERAASLARGAVAVLPNPADRARLAI